MGIEKNEVPTLSLREHLRSMGLEGLPPFKPCVHYFPGIDLLMVNFRDCSVTEITVSDRVDVLLDNYPEIEEPRFAGFQIWGACHFVTRHFGPEKLNQKVALIVEALESVYTKSIFGKFRGSILGAVNQFPLSIDFHKAD